MLAPNPPNRLHCQHSPPPASNQSEQRIRPNGRGSILDADNPAQGVKIARRNTNGISMAEKKAPKRRPLTNQLSQRPSGGTRTPPVGALSQPSQEISTTGGLPGGPERTRTACQARSPVEPVSDVLTAQFAGLELSWSPARPCQGSFTISPRINFGQPTW